MPLDVTRIKQLASEQDDTIPDMTQEQADAAMRLISASTPLPEARDAS